MIEEKAKCTDYSKNDTDNTFSRIAVHVRVKAGQILKARIRARWCMIDWGDGVLQKDLTHKFTEGGFQNINIIGGRINWLNVDGWNATGIYLDRCPFLARLRCQGNKLKELNLLNCPSLVYVDCSHNQINSLMLNGRKILKEIKANNNDLRVVDFSGCLRLQDVDLNCNPIFVTITHRCKKLNSLWFDDARFNPEEYREVADDFPALIINEGGILTIKGDKELIERGKRIIRVFKKEYKKE
ncbi:hypothetical protein [Culturomica massiliensis]|jgi:hypothetical protein|uniref:hypothetical protein n=1 Tax=Culturomica massiliensis TaxID=1841857 RepID=UPI000E55C9EC|nr:MULTISPECIES: hypothetical protein [Odoribacteraceae]RHV89213.1 hypothetical protein DXA95_16090 [Odoribacter sp. OF09-27XD]